MRVRTGRGRRGPSRAPGNDLTRIRFDCWQPDQPSRLLGLAEAEAAYAALPPTASATFSWNDGGDEVVIIGVGEDWSTATMIWDGTFYDLEASEAEGERDIVLCGQVTEYPERLLLPRERGVELLREADADFAALADRYTWVER
ncbi:hypothetical protein GCM10010492_59290 [Saccharothrix mutabilis subsp. mutabilis]|uniref:Uncharacterized protein n=1 Tax=Saccharothrix mutabilis subsp. mutabilis TaxID=66855 RepID=A0ABP3E6P6_9PSEU